MAMRLLRARAAPNLANLKEVRIAVWLDTTKTNDMGYPDEAYIRRYIYQYNADTDGPKNTWIARVRAEVKAACEAELASIVPREGEALAGEGGDL